MRRGRIPGYRSISSALMSRSRIMEAIFPATEVRDAPQYTGGQTSDDVEEYLSLLRESDRAFEQLVNVF